MTKKNKKCPKCGNTSFKIEMSIEDVQKWHYVYRHVYVTFECDECGHEFTEKTMKLEEGWSGG